MEHKVSRSHRAANDRYDAKTYTKITVSFRKDDDADVLESFRAAHKEGLKSREWIRQLFDAAQSK